MFMLYTSGSKLLFFLLYTCRVCGFAYWPIEIWKKAKDEKKNEYYRIEFYVCVCVCHCTFVCMNVNGMMNRSCTKCKIIHVEYSKKKKNKYLSIGILVFSLLLFVYFLIFLTK